MVDSATNCTNTHYDRTFEGDTMSKLGMNIMHSENALEWGEDRQSGSIPMKTCNAFDDQEKCDNCFEKKLKLKHRKRWSN